MARKSVPSSPMQEQAPVNEQVSDRAQTLDPRKAKAGWCVFQAKARCYIDGVLMEDSEQEITLSPSSAYRERKNKNVRLVEGVVPTMPDGAPTDKDARKDFEESFMESLDDGDPILGVPPARLRLIQQSGQLVGSR